MPFAEITIIEGRPTEKKVALIAKVTDAIHEALGAPMESIRVCVREVPGDNWGIGGKTFNEVRRK
ncbi:MAG: 2-hydroxymuconate tautomerase [Rhodospirillales bacterium]